MSRRWRLEQARETMPHLGYMRRYWLERGKIDYRRHYNSQHALSSSPCSIWKWATLTGPEAELEPYIDADSAVAPRDLMAEIIGHTAAGYNAHGNVEAAELARRDAASIAPRKPVYWVAHAVTVVGTSAQLRAGD